MKTRNKVITAFLLAFSLFPISNIKVYADSLYFISTPSFYIKEGMSYSYTPKAVSDTYNSVSIYVNSLPNWLSFNNATDTISGTAPANTGSYVVNIEAKDPSGTSAQQAYYLYVTAPAPTPTPSPTQTPKPTPTSSPVNTATPSPTQTSTPTPLKPTPTAKPSTTPTATPTQSQSNAIIEIYDIYPADKSTIVNSSPVITATINTPFPLNKNNFSITFDNKDVTGSATLLTSKNKSSQYVNTFTLKTDNLSTGVHYVGINITLPSGQFVPKDTTFTVQKAQTGIWGKIKSETGRILTSRSFAIGIIILSLLIFAIIIARLIGGVSGNNKETPPKKL